jgi:hypothetical protein
MIGHIETNLNSLLTLNKKLPALMTLFIDFCIIGEDVKSLMKLAPSISKLRLEGCMKENSAMWETGSYLNNVKEVTLDTSSNADMIAGDPKYEIPDVVNLVYQQCQKYLTCLKLEAVDLSRLCVQPGDLQSLKELKVSNSYQESEISSLLFACQSSLEFLVLQGNIQVDVYDCEFPKLSRVELKHIQNMSSILECAPNLEDLTLVVESLGDLAQVPPNLKVKKLKIVTHGQTGEGLNF